MRILNAAETRRALPMSDAIDAMRAAFGDDRETPLRSLLGSSLFMPGRVGSVSGIKVVSTVPGNPAGIVVVFGADGAPIGAVDGPTLTAIRTAAGCGLATDLLAPPGAATLAMLGAGAMAADQIDAVRTVRPISEVRVWSRSRERASSLAERIGGTAFAGPDETVAGVDIVTTATPAREPLFRAEAAAPGIHVNAVGAFTPEMCEIPAAFVRRAFVVVDDLDAAAAEAGDLLQAGVEPDATVGDLLAGRATAPEGATMFKSVGIASQDVAAAHRALARAAEQGIGTEA
jgi:ornithine cyclodeaminase